MDLEQKRLFVQRAYQPIWAILLFNLFLDPIKGVYVSFNIGPVLLVVAAFIAVMQVKYFIDLRRF